MTEEEKQSLNALIPLILEYRDDIQVLNILSEEAEKAFGSEWRDIIPPFFDDLKSDDIDRLKTNFRRALSYESSVLAWNEANTLLAEDVNLEHLRARLPALEQLLSIFGQAGQDVVNRLKALEQEYSKKEQMTKVESDFSDANKIIDGYSKEVSFNFQYFTRLEYYYEQTVSRIGARCVQLGGIEMSMYPHYGYLLDVLDELVSLGSKLLTDSDYKTLVEGHFPGGLAALSKQVDAYKHELETNATPEMAKDDLNADKLKRELGDIDNTVDNTPIGPAPDGFEPIPDLGEYMPKSEVGDGSDWAYSTKESIGNLNPNVVQDTKPSDPAVPNGPQAS